MNEKLQRAERALLALLRDNSGGLTMQQILEMLSDEIAEAELRAAVWTLKAEGAVDFADGRLREIEHA